MKKNIRKKNYDVNNSMENYSNEEIDKKNKRPKKNDKKHKKKESENILEEIKKEDLNERDEILKEINNTMLKDDENDDENKRNDKPKKDIYKKKEEDDKKDLKEKKQKIKKQKKLTDKNNLSETINEINNELNEQYYLDVENIFEINNKFNYPRNLPFLYIREDNTENDLFPNPLSTMEIKNLLKSKVIKPFLVKIKPIDIFTMKNYPQFSYFDFNEILTKNWSKNLEYSSMFLEEYKNLNERNSLYNLEDKNKTLKISKEYFSYQKLLKKKNIEIENNKIGKMIGKKNNDITLDLNFSISQIDKTGFNDLSMSIIKQLQNVKLTQKQVNKITSIIDEVEEDEWTEIKNKKKENESIPFVGIVGLNESKQITEKNISQNNKKNKKRKDKNKKFVNMKNNQFAGLKINYSSDEENNI